MDGLDGDGHEVAEGVGPEQEGLVHLDAALQSGPAHHRPHTRHRVGVVDLKLGRLVVYNKNKIRLIGCCGSGSGWIWIRNYWIWQKVEIIIIILLLFYFNCTENTVAWHVPLKVKPIR